METEIDGSEGDRQALWNGTGARVASCPGSRVASYANWTCAVRAARVARVGSTAEAGLHMTVLVATVEQQQVAVITFFSIHIARVVCSIDCEPITAHDILWHGQRGGGGRESIL